MSVVRPSLELALSRQQSASWLRPSWSSCPESNQGMSGMINHGRGVSALTICFRQPPRGTEALPQVSNQ